MPKFVSPGAMAGNAIQDFLAQRELQNRQRMIDELMQQKQAADLDYRNRDLAQRTSQQQENQANLEHERGFRRATTLSQQALPGDPVDAATRELMTTHGYGGQVQTTPGILQQGPEITSADADPEGIPTYGVLDIPESSTMRGGSQYLSARAASQERQAQATEANTARVAAAEEAQRGRADENERNRQAAATRATEANDTRAMIAGMANQGRAETTNLRNDLLRTQVDAAGQKAQEKTVSDKRAKDAARVTSGATIDVLKQLADFDANGVATLKPATANLFGARNPLAQYVPGSETATARAAMDRLKGRVIVDLLNEMKNQSRTGATGFGALSGPELALLENAASQLNSSNIGDARAAEELSRIYATAQQLYGDDQAPETQTQTSGGGSFRVVRQR